jgi:hypothetical protein
LFLLVVIPDRYNPFLGTINCQRIDLQEALALRLYNGPAQHALSMPCSMERLGFSFHQFVQRIPADVIDRV